MGATGDDTIVAAAGDDTIGSAVGDDTLGAGAGADTAAAGDGDDTIEGAAAGGGAATSEAGEPDVDDDKVEVILTTSLSAPGWSKKPGDPYRCSPAEAKRLRDAGFAEPEA
ncbi:hypothetical protein HY78_01020 [Rhizorhabdus wittichii DC-6]|nr:hypothetical protein HY78_01020 [Rhizorhabdus wittichii DC-6]